MYFIWRGCPFSRTGEIFCSVSFIASSLSSSSVSEGSHSLSPAPASDPSDLLRSSPLPSCPSSSSGLASLIADSSRSWSILSFPSVLILDDSKGPVFESARKITGCKGCLLESPKRKPSSPSPLESALTSMISPVSTWFNPVSWCFRLASLLFDSLHLLCSLCGSCSTCEGRPKRNGEGFEAV